MTTPPPTLEYQPPAPVPSLGRRLLGPAWVVSSLALLALVGFVLANVNRHTSNGFDPRGKCASNEHQIYLGILLYQQDHNGHYPPSLANVLAEEQIGPEAFVCPSANDTAAVLPTSPPTTQQAVTALAAPGHLSYVYFGHADWTDAIIRPDSLVLAEPPSDHDKNGCNFLYADGHVDWVPMPRAARLIAAASATSRPVSAASVP